MIEIYERNGSKEFDTNFGTFKVTQIENCIEDGLPKFKIDMLIVGNVYGEVAHQTGTSEKNAIENLFKNDTTEEKIRKKLDALTMFAERNYRTSLFMRQTAR